MVGRLEVITGPMFSGKSEELMRRLRRLEIAGNKVALFKPAIDDRYGRDKVISHSGHEMDAFLVDHSDGVIIQGLGYSVIGIDEIQFIENALQAVKRLRDRGTIIIVSGLDLTYRGEPFGDVPILLAIADKIDKLNAVCHSCGADATMTQRLINGQPASFDGPTVQVGGLDSYEARCRKCYQEK